MTLLTPVPGDAAPSPGLAGHQARDAQTNVQAKPPYTQLLLKTGITFPVDLYEDIY